MVDTAKTRKVNIKKTAGVTAGVAVGVAAADTAWQVGSQEFVAGGLNTSVGKIGHGFGSVTTENILAYGGYPVLLGALSGLVYYAHMKFNVIPQMVDKQIAAEIASFESNIAGMGEYNESVIARRAELTAEFEAAELKSAKGLAVKVGFAVAGYTIAEELFTHFIDGVVNSASADPILVLLVGLGATLGVTAGLALVTDKEDKLGKDRGAGYAALQKGLALTVFICATSWYGFSLLAESGGVEMQLAAYLLTAITVGATFLVGLPRFTEGFKDAASPREQGVCNKVTAFVYGVQRGPEAPAADRNAVNDPDEFEATTPGSGF